MRTPVLDQLNTRRGFVTLYAMAVIVAMVAIATSIGVIGSSQFQIAATGALSQRAQYHAESALECGMYAVIADKQTGVQQSVSCGGAGQIVDSRETDPQLLFFGGGGCAVLTIESDRIRASGYNSGNAGTGQCPDGARVQQTFSVRID